MSEVSASSAPASSGSPSAPSGGSPSSTPSSGGSGSGGASSFSPPTGGAQKSPNTGSVVDNLKSDLKVQGDLGDFLQKKVKVPVDGKEIEVSIDEMRRDYSLKQASMKRFEEAAQARKQVEEFRKRFRENPREALSDPSIVPEGFDVRKFAEEILAEHIQSEMLSPAERQLKQLQQENEKLKTEAQKRAEAENKTQFETAKTQSESRFAQKFTDALEASGLPKSPFTLKRMAEYQKRHLTALIRSGVPKEQLGQYDLTPQELGQLVRSDYDSEVGGSLSGLSAEQLIATLGEEGANKVREYFVKMAQGQTQQPQSFATPKVEKPKTPLSVRDFSEQLRREVGL